MECKQAWLCVLCWVIAGVLRTHAISCNTGLASAPVAISPIRPFPLPPGLAESSPIAQKAYSTAFLEFRQGQDPWQEADVADEFMWDKRLLVPPSNFSAGARALLDALNLTDAAASGALASVQRLQLFRRWVVTATSPESLENTVLPAVIRSTGLKLLLRDSFISVSSSKTPTPSPASPGRRKMHAVAEGPVDIRDPFSINPVTAVAGEGRVYKSGTPEVPLAVIDTGCDIKHPDLGLNIWKSPYECDQFGLGNNKDDNQDGIVDDCAGFNFLNHTTDVRDFDGSGTHVAGIIGAVGLNGLSIAGANYRTSMMILKALDQRINNTIGAYGTASAAIAAWAYAERNGARIIHNSWTTPGTYVRDSPEAAALTQQYLSPMRRLADAGIVSVWAAGDDGVDMDANTTSKFPVVLQTELKLTVAAASPFAGSFNIQSKTPESNFGRSSADFAVIGVYTSTVPVLLGYEDDYNGTAQAAAISTGVAGLCLATMQVCDFTNSYYTSRRPPPLTLGGSPAWPTPPQSIWYTKQANDAVYKCMTVGSLGNKGVTELPVLRNVTRLGGSLNPGGVVECCLAACNVTLPFSEDLVKALKPPGGAGGFEGGGRDTGDSRGPGDGFGGGEGGGFGGGGGDAGGF